MTEEPKFMPPVNARWDPEVRHAVAMKRIRLAVEKALGHPDVRFTAKDLDYVASLMGVRKKIDPDKRYRLKSGEIVTGAELLRRRTETQAASGDD